MRSARHKVKKADREVDDLWKRLGDAESRAASTREELQRAIETWDHHQAEGQALAKRYEDQGSAITEVLGRPEADEEVLHRVDTTIAKALAVIVGADGILDSRWEKP